MLEMAMLVTFGFVLACLLALMVAPILWRRAERLTTLRVRGNWPLSVADIQAEKDQLRAEFAMAARRLEQNVETLKNRAADQVIELGRRSEEIDEAMGQLEARKRHTDQLQNTISERDALIVRRDQTIAQLTEQLARAGVETKTQQRVASDANSALDTTQQRLTELQTKHSQALILADERRVEIAALKTTMASQLDTIDRLEQELSSALRESELGLNAARNNASATLEAAQKRAKAALAAARDEAETELESVRNESEKALVAVRKQMEYTLNEQKQSAEEELESTRTALEQELSAVREAAESERQSLVRERAALIADAEGAAETSAAEITSLREAMTQQQQEASQDFAFARQQAEQDLTLARQKAAKELASAQQAAEQNLSALRDAHAKEISQIKRATAQEVETAKAASRRDVEALRQAASQDWSAAQQHMDQLRAEVEKLTSEIADKDRRIILLDDDIEQLQTERNQVHDDLYDARTKLDELAGEQSGNAGLLVAKDKELTKKIRELRDAKRQIEQLLNNAKQTEAHLNQIMDDHQREIAALRNNIEELEQGKNAAHAEIINLRKKAKSLAEAVESGWEEERSENALLRERLNDVAAEIAHMTTILDDDDGVLQKLLATSGGTPRKNMTSEQDLATQDLAAGTDKASVKPSTSTLPLLEKIKALQQHSRTR